MKILFLLFLFPHLAFATSGINLSSGFNILAPQAVDSRIVVADDATRNLIDSGVRYELLTVCVAADEPNACWQLQGGITNSNWVNVGGATNVPATTFIVTSAGVTPLTVNSSATQVFIGTHTQTVILPNATTLTKGQRFTFINSSTGSITIKDNNSISLGVLGATTLTTTASSIVFSLTSNSTPGGVWAQNVIIQTPTDTATTNPGDIMAWNDNFGTTASDVKWNIGSTGTLVPNASLNLPYINFIQSFNGNTVSNVIQGDINLLTNSTATQTAHYESINLIDNGSTGSHYTNEVGGHAMTYNKALPGTTDKITLYDASSDISSGIAEKFNGYNYNNIQTGGVVRQAAAFTAGNVLATGTDTSGNVHLALAYTCGNITASGSTSGNYAGCLVSSGSTISGDVGKTYFILNQSGALSSFVGSPIEIDSSTLTLSKSNLSFVAPDTPFAAEIHLDQQTDPISVSDGDTWDSATTHAIKHQSNGYKETLTGNVFSQTSSVTIANTITATTLTGAGVGTLTIPSNYLVIGKTFEIKASGFWNSDAIAPTIQVVVSLNGTTINDTGQHTVFANASNSLWELYDVCTVRSIGGSGSVFCQGRFDTSSSTSLFNRWEMPTSGTTLVTTTAPLPIDVKLTWGTANAANSITCTNLTVQMLN